MRVILAQSIEVGSKLLIWKTISSTKVKLGANCACGMDRWAYLAHGDGQCLNDLLVCHGHHTLSVYFNDSVADPNPTALSDTTPH